MSGLLLGWSGHTLTLVVILGSTWSPEISTLASGQYRQACSGACPITVNACQARPPMVTTSPSRTARNSGATVGTSWRKWFPRPRKASTDASGTPWRR